VGDDVFVDDLSPLGGAATLKIIPRIENGEMVARDEYGKVWAISKIKDYSVNLGLVEQDNY